MALPGAAFREYLLAQEVFLFVNPAAGEGLCQHFVGADVAHVLEELARPEDD